MTTTAAPILHIRTDERGVASIDSTGVKVKQLVSFRRGWAWTPEQIHENLPHLSLAQIYAAFAYYHDHQAQIDAEIAEDQAEADRIAGQHPISAGLQERLRAARTAK